VSVEAGADLCGVAIASIRGAPHKNDFTSPHAAPSCAKDSGESRCCAPPHGGAFKNLVFVFVVLFLFAVVVLVHFGCVVIFVILRWAVR
jgi:hypothetical protein